MRRLARILMNAATAASLVLFVLTVLLWVPSYWSGFVAAHSRAGSVTYWAFHGGRLVYATQTPDRPHPFVRPDGWYFRVQGVSHGPTRAHRREQWGFGGDSLAEPMSDPAGNLICNYRWTRRWIPAWAVAVFTGVLPLRMGRALFARRRGTSPSGACPACGYDLRATPGRCPECGAATTAPGSHDRLDRAGSDG